MNKKGKQNKAIIGIGLFILILFLGYAINNELTLPAAFSTVFATTGCTDSDGLDPYTKGNVNGISDFCFSSTKVVEMTCSAGERKALIITCDSTCSDGACVGGGTSPPPTPPPPTDQQCSGAVSPTSECCTNEPECGYKNLVGYQELILAYCGSDGNLYGNYFEWLCQSNQCVQGSSRSKQIETCSNGCQSTGEFGAECKGEPLCSFSGERFVSCRSDANYDYETMETCVNGQIQQTEFNCQQTEECVDGIGCQSIGPSCTDECGTKGAICAGSTSYVTCDNFDSDSCLERKTRGCPTDTVCVDIGSNEIACRPPGVLPTPETKECTIDGVAKDFTCKAGIDDKRFFDRCVDGTWVEQWDWCPPEKECREGDVGCSSGDCTNLKGDLPEDQCSADGTKVLSFRYGSYPACSVSSSTREDCAAQNKDCSNGQCVAKKEELHSCSVTAEPVLVLYDESGMVGSSSESNFPTFTILGITPKSKIVNTDQEARISLRQTIQGNCPVPHIRLIVENTDPLTKDETSKLNIRIPIRDKVTDKLIDANVETCFDQEMPVDYDIRFKSGITGTFNIEATIVCGHLQGATPTANDISETDTFTITVQGGETCGNKVQEGFERCDGPDLDGVTCDNFASQGKTGEGLQCKSDCTDFDITECDIIKDAEFCSDGTPFGECSDVYEEMKCVDGKLAPSSGCCGLAGKSLDHDTNECVSFTDCTFGVDNIECKNGVEKQCTSLNVWRTTNTCEQEFCKLDEGCIASVDEETNTTTGRTGGKTNPCSIDACQKGCDQTHLEKVCGQIGEDFAVYDNKCKALEAKAEVVGTESLCIAIEAAAAEKTEFELEGGTIAIIIAAVAFVIVLIIFSRPR